MTSTLVDEYHSLFRQLLFLHVDVSVIVVTYLTLIRLIGVSFSGIFDLVFPVWDPVPFQYTPITPVHVAQTPQAVPSISPLELL